MNIALLLQMMTDAAPDRVAICGGGHRLTYHAVEEAARQFAARLAGEREGSVVFLAENHPAAAVALFGAAIMGRPYVPVNYRLTDTEITTLLERARPVRIISHGVVPGHDVISPDDLIAASVDEVPRDFGCDDEAPIAVELFTSGTTGAPKAALLRHQNLLAYILGTVEFLSAEESEAALITVPPYHIAGISAVMSNIYAGRRIVLLPAFSPEAWVQTAHEEAITSAFLVPTMMQRIVDYAVAHPETAALPNLRSLAYGGGRMPRETIEAAMQLWPHVDFTNAYGLTETSSTICLLTPDDHRTAAGASEERARARIGSVGQPVPGIELAIRDDTGVDVNPGDIGLVHVRGDQVAGEYRELGSQFSADGWFCTRDRGWLDDAGYLFLDGRADDIIVRGAENISPGEIEAVLCQHTGVREAAVFGVPDSEWGEAVAAAIVLARDTVPTAELQQFVQQQLRSSRVPQHIRFVPELPHNEMGKLLRRRLRDEFLQNESAFS